MGEARIKARLVYAAFAKCKEDMRALNMKPHEFNTVCHIADACYKAYHGGPVAQVTMTPQELADRQGYKTKRTIQYHTAGGRAAGALGYQPDYIRSKFCAKNTYTLLLFEPPYTAQMYKDARKDAARPVATKIASGSFLDPQEREKFLEKEKELWNTRVQEVRAQQDTPEAHAARLQQSLREWRAALHITQEGGPNYLDAQTRILDLEAELAALEARPPQE